MRAIRLFLLLSILALVGAAILRPEGVVPFALSFVEPLLADPRLAGGSKIETAAQQVPPVAAPAPPKADIAAASPAPGLPDVASIETPSSDQPELKPGDTRRTVVLVAEADPPKPSAAKADDAAANADAPSSDESKSGDRKNIQVEPQLGSLTPKASLTPEPYYPGGAKIVTAKNLFGAAKSGAPLAARAIGFYAKGCLSGGVALPVDGPAWQAMRLARNRNWGHPKLIELVEQLGKDAKKLDNWNGLLVGDISQARGGPMLSGHASHQVGLDADVWLTEMPARTLTTKERDEMPATSMLDATDAAVDPKVFTEKQVALIKRASSYPEVDRIFVHPAIKKALCKAAGTDRKWLWKVRQIPGHYYHFHIRIKCPPGFAGCAGQPPVGSDEGCGKDLDRWLASIKAQKKTAPAPVVVAPVKPPVTAQGKLPPPPMMLSQLPKECAAVLESGTNAVLIPKEALGPPPTPPKQKPAVAAAAAHAKGAAGAVPAAAVAPPAAAAPAAATPAAAASKPTLRPVKDRYVKTSKP